VSKCKSISDYLCPQPTMPVRPMGDCETFALGDCERALFDCITSEHVNIIGTSIAYYTQNISQSIVDPVYNEPVKRAWLGPYLLKAFVTLAKTTGVAMEGLSSQFDGELWLPRSECERVNMLAPSETDIVRVWDTPYYNTEFAVDGFDIPGAGLYFAITDVQEDGTLFDNPSFVGFKCTLRRTTQQTPERKLVTSI